MKVCYFGFYNRDYSRNRVLIRGLKENRIRVIECHSNLSGISKYWDLIKKHWAIRKKYDFIIVGFPGHQAMILAKFLSRKPIIFDAFLSLYDSVVFDRQLCSKKSLRTIYYWFLDWLPCHLADAILLDSQAHIDYFIKSFNLKSKKIYRVFVGTDDKIIYPISTKKEKHNYFLVHFHGSFIPLQGIEYIVQAAKILERDNIKFNIIGRGQRYKEIIKLVNKLKISNIKFIDPVPYEKLREYICQADVCLGIFGQTPKTKRVIPNKVYEAIACAKPVITSRQLAIKEIFIDRENIIMCQPGNSQDLAQKILELKSNQDLRLEIGQRAFSLFKEKLTPKKIVNNLLLEIKKNNARPY